MLNMEHVQRCSLAPDERGLRGTYEHKQSYIERYGTSQTWEVDALGKRGMREILECEIKSLIDWDLWREVEAENSSRQQALDTTVERILDFRDEN